MKRRLYALLFGLSLLPMSITAQTTKVIETENGKTYTYLDDGDGRLYIHVAQSGNISTTEGTVPANFYFKNDNLKKWLRSNKNGGQNKFYKEDLDAIEDLTIPSLEINTYQGIEYFRNLKTLTTTNSTNSLSTTVSLDVSGTKIESVNVISGTLQVLQFITGNDDAVKKTLDVSECGNLMALTCTGKGVETLNMYGGATTLSNLRVLNIKDSGIKGVLNLTGLLSLGSVNLTNLEITEVIGVAARSEFSLNVTGTKIQNIEATGVTNLTIQSGDNDDVKKTVDVSRCPYLYSLTCTGRGINNLILKSEGGTTGDKIQTLDIKNTDINKLDLYEIPNVVKLNIDGTNIGGVLDVRGLAKLKELTMGNTPVEELNAEGNTSLERVYTASSPDFLGRNKYFNYNPATGEGTRLKKIKVKGCTALTTLNITQESSGWAMNAEWFMQSLVEEVDAEGCTSLTSLTLINSPLQKLNVKGCVRLKSLDLVGNNLTAKSLLEGGIAACPIAELNLHRNRLTDINFITTPSDVWPAEWKTWAGSYLRTQTEVDKLTKLWFNGGSRVKREYIGTDPSVYTGPYTDNITVRNGEYYTYWIEPGDEFTNIVRDLDLTYATNLTYLHCADNLLKGIDLSVIGPNLREFEAYNNMFAALDLSNVDATKLSNSGWTHQISFRELEVLKGGVSKNADGTYPKTDGACSPGVLREDGENDMILLPLDAPAQENSIELATVGPEDDVDIRTDGHNYNTAVAGSDGLMDIITLKQDGKLKYYMKTHDAAIHTSGDADMHRMVLSYKNETGLQNPGTYTSYIRPQVHVDPYVVYLNPIFRSPYDEIDYYSGTVCVSYEWEVPKGLEAYIAVGVKDVKYITEDGTTAADGQLNLVCIGREGDIIPKNTAVYLRTVAAFENVVKADGTTPAKKTGGKSHVGGFYALHNNWDMDFLGWQNTKADEIAQRVFISKDGQLKPTVKGNHVTIDGVSTLIDDDLLYNKNLLKCYKVEDDIPTEAYYYVDVDDTNRYHHYFPEMTTVDADGTTPLKYNVLTLGREKNIGTLMIGFWPYTGASIPPHRCYIKISDVVDLLSSSSSSPGLGALSRGLTFHFDDSAETGVREFTASEKAETKDNAWYTLSGMRLQEKPTQPGMYVNNGKKVYIK